MRRLRLWLRVHFVRQDRLYRVDRHHRNPGPWMGTMRPAPAREKTRKIHLAHLRHREHCDGCGRSRDLLGVSTARFEVVTGQGSLFVCGHHFREHRIEFHMRGYEVIEHG